MTEQVVVVAAGLVKGGMHARICFDRCTFLKLSLLFFRLSLSPMFAMKPHVKATCFVALLVMAGLQPVAAVGASQAWCLRPAWWGLPWPWSFVWPLEGAGAGGRRASPSRGGDWIRVRPAEAEADTLHELNKSAHAALGQQWDVDFVSLEICPGCLPVLSDFWEVGGRATRPANSAFPYGLEVSCSPFTLRIASMHHSAMSADHESELRAAGERLRQFLEASGVTGRPVLSPPSSQQGGYAQENSWQLLWPNAA